MRNAADIPRLRFTFPRDLLRPSLVPRSGTSTSSGTAKRMRAANILLAIASGVHVSCAGGLGNDHKPTTSRGESYQEYSNRRTLSEQYSSPLSAPLVKDEVYASRACAEFDDNGNALMGWLPSDCVDIWTSWSRTLEAVQFSASPYRNLFNETATELRKQGNPCLVESVSYPDGAGSSSIRYLATWIFAEEMGCSWVMPGGARPSIDDRGTTLYCHKSVTFSQLRRNGVGNETENISHLRCSMTNWLDFFRYRDHSISDISTAKAATIMVKSSESANSLVSALREYHIAGENNRPWAIWRFKLGKSAANRIFQAVPTWDHHKRAVTRRVLRRYREGFHEFPRPWYDKKPQCRFSTSPKVLDFAIHVRLGDRETTFRDKNDNYFTYLEEFMETVTRIVTRKGQDPPMFHIFSETEVLCPSLQDGTFKEFPHWPVAMDQIPPCLAPVTPDECPEKEAGAPMCNPERSGIFRIAEKPIYLHVGLDVQNEMSCMIQADGVAMGCSTFGQVAGVLNRGIRFFSYECQGVKTPNHYKMMPPLAIAEQGYMWVPMSGSWHNPQIASERIFEAALDEHLRNRS